ncbi:hypothetical protein JCM9140_1139 [Halalkalibacter wakoensis JCM 9140]|uniref:Uncharacterized protein n=1 Tax=Halalkalibacter wakoensis JCM 9140 TaxID=1236970 RepID=W4PZ94_9BACI|nr:hypothetical protein [Halalkalibacter wakoensis]GAE25161.1 hypothetical protein JCM9140_1139 [Halalkalibacter wakoensis JCM 9140]
MYGYELEQMPHGKLPLSARERQKTAPSRNNDSNQLQRICQLFHHSLVTFQTKTGFLFEGIITGTDDEGVYVLLSTNEQKYVSFSSLTTIIYPYY